MERANDVLDFWFDGKSGSNAGASTDPAWLAERSIFWFGGDDPAAAAARDTASRARLEPLLERAARGELASWASSPKRRLALIILFDQVPRNAYRGTAAAFAFDREALQLSVEGLHLAADAALDPVERLFFYLPLEHAESIEAQDAAVAALERLVRDATPELREFMEFSAGYARKHREIIARFGRFPHRNGVLGRESTPAEREWLAESGESFGQ
jgi:uncharacterized protein (DUF924 family)